jgi:hypothetical protein
VRKAAALAASVALVALVVTASLAAVAPPTGDKPAIAFYKRAVGPYSRLPGAKVVETGYFFGHPAGGKSVDYSWAHPPKPGFVPQTATILERLIDGQVVAYLAELTAPNLRRVRILMAGGSVFVSSGKCWNKAGTTSSPLGTGDAFLFNDGGARFSPLVRTGGSTIATFTYSWNPGAQAVETTTFSAGPTPSVHTVIEVTGTERMSIVKKITPLTTAPDLPVPSPPGLPVPKHLCGSG